MNLNKNYPNSYKKIDINTDKNLNSDYIIISF